MQSRHTSPTPKTTKALLRKKWIIRFIRVNYFCMTVRTARQGVVHAWTPRPTPAPVYAHPPESFRRPQLSTWILQSVWIYRLHCGFLDEIDRNTVKRRNVCLSIKSRCSLLVPCTFHITGCLWGGGRGEVFWGILYFNFWWKSNISGDLVEEPRIKLLLVLSCFDHNNKIII